MNPQLVGAAMNDAQWERLDAIADVVDRTPFGSLEGERAESVLADVDVLLGHWGCPTIDEPALARMPKLQMLAYAAGSVKERATVTPAVFERGVLVTSAASANAVPVAEYTLAAILLANKGAFLSREWYRNPDGLRARRPKPVGNYRRVIGLVGASHVGRLVIELLRPFRFEVLLADPFVDAAAAAALGVELVDLDDLLDRCEVLSIHAPDVPATVGMIGPAELARLRDGAVVINTARGRLIDTEALVAEVSTGRLSAILDVTEPEPLPRDSPLFDLPNVFLTPHLAGSQGNELERLADLAITEIERFVRGEPPLFPVDPALLDRMA